MIRSGGSATSAASCTMRSVPPAIGRCGWDASIANASASVRGVTTGGVITRGAGGDDGQVGEVAPVEAPITRQQGIRLGRGVRADQEVGHDPRPGAPGLPVACPRRPGKNRRIHARRTVRDAQIVHVRMHARRRSIPGHHLGPHDLAREQSAATGRMTERGGGVLAVGRVGGQDVEKHARIDCGDRSLRGQVGRASQFLDHPIGVPPIRDPQRPIDPGDGVVAEVLRQHDSSLVHGDVQALARTQSEALAGSLGNRDLPSLTDDRFHTESVCIAIHTVKPVTPTGDLPASSGRRVRVRGPLEQPARSPR